VDWRSRKQKGHHGQRVTQESRTLEEASRMIRSAWPGQRDFALHHHGTR
jgi:hypothetical protein